MRNLRKALLTATASLTTLMVVAAATPARAQDGQPQAYHLPAQPLAEALRAIAAQTGRAIIAPAALLKGKTAPAIQGSYSADAAVQLALAGSGLRARTVGDGLVVEAVQDTPAPADGDAAPGKDIIVTGSRIRGTPVASPVITETAEAMRDSGQTGLGDVVRALPQSFGGGQNPGLGSNVPSASGADVSGASSINLRGLGSDATLTLLNGHRLAYNASRQSVDVSAIPIGIVDRVEIVPDGASALYGSDAVAGVANIIFKRDYEGLETGARLGWATDGGDFQQHYDVVGGHRWDGGGIIATYEYGDARGVLSDQRDYARHHAGGLTLFPPMRHHSAALSGHEALTDNLTFSVDALFNSRESTTYSPANIAGDPMVSRSIYTAFDHSWGVAPSLALKLGAAWRVTLDGSYGKEHVDATRVQCQLGLCGVGSGGYYRNTERSAELNADGPLFAMPGGDVRIALGAGYREIGFRRDAGAGSPVNTLHAQDSYFAFGELSLPLVDAAQGWSFLNSLELSAALRYERYPGIGEVVTPKLGVIAAPTPDFSIKASWGRSFRAPTLYQQYQPEIVYLYPAAPLGGTGLPATAATLLVLGGNPALKPERAQTWSATLDLHPGFAGGARLQISYFNVQYRDRIVTPITFLSQALSNPIYQDLIARNPSAASQQAVIASAFSFASLTGGSYDPTQVVAIVNNSNLNAGRQDARGVDLLADYVAPLAGGKLRLALNASYLDSSQQLSSGQPVTPLAGIIFNPPHWRGHATASWAYGPLTVTGDLSRIGGVDDSRRSPVVHIPGMTTFDLTAGYRFAGVRTALSGVSLILSAQNLFDAAPSLIATTAGYDTPYDSTNYSPLGRVLTIGVSKKW
ncbi:hypothetical protein GCM10009087_18140 [Sphingomonas oligophenolica]|uniref:TonB-dependent receptor n=1 Tax=Sphingomonas oligophenolica TaxID=301154 RepID=A0ABU9Y3E9_9SPHN